MGRATNVFPSLQIISAPRTSRERGNRRGGQFASHNVSEEYGRHLLDTAVTGTAGHPEIQSRFAGACSLFLLVLLNANLNGCSRSLSQEISSSWFRAVDFHSHFRTKVQDQPCGTPPGCNIPQQPRRIHLPQLNNSRVKCSAANGISNYLIQHYLLALRRQHEVLVPKLPRQQQP
ncbi:hypothetical protein CVT26_003936 [Gymnopilus dilepis]|uniref:Uncharacterized protein n=1 Tax=Gymnopilus dilepis TaxID=231916 RepID=A0A409WPR8_9AGAR|nr:hypothetical protein CVT26_003936 [Gymnopilus dilepis]